MKWRITHISDTHNNHNQLNGKLPGGDLLIHSGDVTSIGRKSEVERFIKWFNGIDNYTHKIFIAGNHDLTFDREILYRDKAAYFDGASWTDEVANGKVVCIIEAMKLFNEIESEIKGKIVKVLVDDASPVEYDQPLFLVDPS